MKYGVSNCWGKDGIFIAINTSDNTKTILFDKIKLYTNHKTNDKL